MRIWPDREGVTTGKKVDKGSQNTSHLLFEIQSFDIRKDRKIIIGDRPRFSGRSREGTIVESESVGRDPWSHEGNKNFWLHWNLNSTPSLDPLLPT